MNWTGQSNTTFTGSGYNITWNTSRWVAVGQGGNSIAYSYDGLNWFGVPNSALLYGEGGYAVGANPKIGFTPISSAIHLNLNDRFSVNTPKYYDNSLSSDTALSFNLNLSL